MIGSVRRWQVLMVLTLFIAVAAGCAQHYYAPGSAGPDNLTVNVQYHWVMAGLGNQIVASALVVRPDGSYQKVDNFKIWIKSKDLADYSENFGEYEISARTYRPVAPSDDPRAYACATYKGQTFCGGDQSAR
jgi:hypothetical protein